MKTTTDTIMDDIRSIVADMIGVEASGVDGHVSLKELGIDSLHMVEIAMAIEDKFGIEIPEHDAASFTTVADASRYIATRIPA